ncbi:MAG: class I SAM-dependent methyltransferase [Cyclobacteriaceae bacterium]|nr:class I SAM-dependent methyltransferase [Cyclobacteriaceae bacterium]
MNQLFKKIIYSKYVSNHNNFLYGQNSLASIRRHFSSWKYYFKELLPNEKQSTILDVGCGDGNFVYWLKQLGYSNASGIDLSPEQINSGLSMGITDIQVADVRNFLKERSSFFDFIIMRDVLEHFAKDQVFEILDLVFRSLKPSGSIMIQVPNGQGIFYTSIYYGDFTHEWAYTRSSLNQIFLNTGFRDVRCFEMGPAPVNTSGFIRLLFWRYKVLVNRFWKFVESGNSQGIFSSNIIALARK